VRNAGAQKGLADGVKALCADPPRDAVVLIEATDLKKGAALRSAVELAGCAMALPCYADEAKSIDALIDEELQKARMLLTPDARQALRRSLGGDRLASRGEITKLTLYALGKSEIGLDDVRTVTGNVSDLSVDDAIDRMLEGNIAELDAVVTRFTLSGSQSFLLLAAAIRQMQAIHLMRGMMEAGSGNAASAVAAARPPILFWRRKIIEQAVGQWSVEALARALARLHAAVLQTRRRPDLSAAITRQTLLAIAVEGARMVQKNR
jgi:DNA polymerase-3 subunit delta